MKNDQSDRNKDANPDPITGKPGAHPVGTGVGAATGGIAGGAVGAAATGAAAGSAAGPIGTAAGLVGGAVVGGLAGKGVAEAANPSEQQSGGRDYSRLVGYAVHDESNNKIGTVHNLWTDEKNQPAFLGVKTGWIFGKNHVVPVHTAQVNERQQIIRLPYSEMKIKEAPAYDSEAELSDAQENEIYRYYGVQMPRVAASMPQASAPQPTRGREAETASVKLSEEQLRVGKREVIAGGVRLRKIVRTETVNQPVELKREEVVIERVPATGPQAGTAQFGQEDVFIPLRREEAVVQKEGRVREEVRVRKEATTEQQTVSGQVRKEDVEIQNEGDARFATGGEKEARQQTGRYEPKERSKR